MNETFLTIEQDFLNWFHEVSPLRVFWAFSIDRECTVADLLASSTASFLSGWATSPFLSASASLRVLFQRLEVSITGYRFLHLGRTRNSLAILLVSHQRHV